jgi:MFS transporter, DHA1 family, staphyloferrin A biosynthesis exporter
MMAVPKRPLGGRSRLGEDGGEAVVAVTEAAKPSRTGARVSVLGRGRRTLASLRHRDFALLWGSSAVMSAGQWLQQVTLSWLVFEMTGSAFLLGLINGVRLLPFLFTSLISGVLADRMDRRRLLLGTQIYLCSMTLLMGLLLLSGRTEIWHLFVFTFVSGLGWSFTMPVRQSLVSSLVPREDVLNAVALSSAAFNLTRMIGPAAGGLLLATVGGGGNFLVQAGCYALVVGMVYAMRVPALPPREDGRSESMWQSMAEGVRYVGRTPLLLTLLLLALVPMTLGMPYQSLLPIFAADVYGIGAGGLGFLIAIAGVGSFIATLWVAGAGDLRRRGLVQLIALGGMGLALVLFSRSGWLPLAVVFLLILGACQMAYMTINQTLLQTTAPESMRGRVMSLYMLNVGLVPAGSFAAGAVAEFAGAPATLTLMGILIAGIAVLALLRLPALRGL